MSELLTGTWPLGVAVVTLVLAAAVIAAFGSQLARVVDRLADRTGLGEALAGAVLLAAATSIAGLVVTLVAAAEGQAGLAIGNASGGIAAQTAFIVVADLAYRRANLEHAAASITNVFNTLLIVVLLAVVILGAASPPWEVLGVHPATALLLGTYLYGLWIGRRIHQEPMWQPEETTDTEPDEPDAPEPGETLSGLWRRFALLGVVVAAAGWVVSRAGLSVVEATAVSGTFVGALFTAVATSLPELVTSVAAVRAGALTLAVGGIVGGNAFDVVFIGVADLVYRDGTIYGAMGGADLFVVAWTMLLSGIVGAGLVRRQRRGVGFEGAGILLLYVAGLAVVSGMGT